MRTILPSLLNFLGMNIQGDLDGITCWRSARGAIIWYPRAPPRKPPSPLQVLQRQKWTDILVDWNNFTEAQRQAWLDLADQAHTRITGLNLYLWYRCSQDDRVIHTLELQTGITVLP